MVAGAILALVVFRFCLGSFVFYAVTGREAFARGTAPWAPDFGPAEGRDAA